ncbi:MAG TPA: FAD:protein FMN transferase [Blastocatellia bacterium]|nr:FAD:protein FMN transferase [Blastocatellia bacterium]
MSISERIMPSSIRFVIILAVLLIATLIETERSGSRSANCPVCESSSLAHRWMLRKPGGSHVLLTSSVIGEAQTGQFALRPAKTRRFEDSRVSMGCVYMIVVYGRKIAPLREAAAAALDEVDRIDRLMSNYKNDSELSRVNREAAERAIRVDPELFDFIAECLRYSRESDGAFDITVGPLMKAWGFFRGEGRAPGEAELAEARNRVGYQHVILNQKDGTIFFDKAGVELDLGGIAKGYAVDRAVAVLKQHGVTSALVSSGGSTIYALGAPPGKPAWEVEVQDPVERDKIATTVRLKDQSLSVSGSYEKFFELDGVRYSHVMDPRTGRPVQGVLSVAVITGDGTSGDALDNVFYALGVERSRAWLKKFSANEVIFFLPESGKRWKMVRIRKGARDEQKKKTSSHQSADFRMRRANGRRL